MTKTLAPAPRCHPAGTPEAVRIVRGYLAAEVRRRDAAEVARQAAKERLERLAAMGDRDPIATIRNSYGRVAA